MDKLYCAVCGKEICLQSPYTFKRILIRTEPIEVKGLNTYEKDISIHNECMPEVLNTLKSWNEV